MVTAFLSGGDNAAVLMGDTTVTYENGAATFTNLAVSKPGTGYSLSFMVTSPDTASQLSVSLDTPFT